jgi:hypothetical protein
MSGTGLRLLYYSIVSCQLSARIPATVVMVNLVYGTGTLPYFNTRTVSVRVGGDGITGGRTFDRNRLTATTPFLRCASKSSLVVVGFVCIAQINGTLHSLREKRQAFLKIGTVLQCQAK